MLLPPNKPQWADRIVHLTICLFCSAGFAQANDAGLDTKVPATTSVQYHPYVEIEGGHDSNPDNRFRKDGSDLVKLESGMSVSKETDFQLWNLTLKGRFVDFSDLEEARTDRWDALAGYDTTFTLSPTEKLSLGTSYLRDFFSFDRADVFNSYADYVLTGSNMRLRLQGRSHVERNIEDDEVGTEPPNVFDVVRDKAFDYARSDGQIGLLGFTKLPVQPFAIYEYADLDYFNQASNAMLDRNAVEQFGIVGFRIQPQKTFRVDVGYRLNQRDFSDRTVDKFDSDFIDVNAFWQPADNFKVTAVVERYFKEPSTSFGLADDTKSYSMTLDWEFQPKWRLTGALFYERQAPIGERLLYDKFTTTAAVNYAKTPNLDLFVSVLGRWVDEEVTDDSYDRFKFGSGMRFKY